MSGKYVYVLPNETMYKRVTTAKSAREMMLTTGFLSIRFSGQMAVIKTRPGYASSIAYNIDAYSISGVIGSIAGADTIFVALESGVSHEKLVENLGRVIPDIKYDGR